jgi:hypothetical protein
LTRIGRILCLVYAGGIFTACLGPELGTSADDTLTDAQVDAGEPTDAGGRCCPLDLTHGAYSLGGWVDYRLDCIRYTDSRRVRFRTFIDPMGCEAAEPIGVDGSWYGVDMGGQDAGG